MDLERWRSIFAGEVSKEKMFEDFPHLKEQGFSSEEFSRSEDDHCVTIVRVGGSPSAEDLELYREIFEEASKDPDFKIFTHHKVDVQQYKFENDSLVLVER